MTHVAVAARVLAQSLAAGPATWPCCGICLANSAHVVIASRVTVQDGEHERYEGGFG
jgi:hypothetical protein